MVDSRTLITPNWRVVFEERAILGENPIFHCGNLFWIDIFEPSLSRISICGGDYRKWNLPHSIGCFALTDRDDDLLVALQAGVYAFDLEKMSLRLLADAPYDTSQFRFNDGACDRAGRFWVGTNILPDSEQPEGSAALYRYDERGLVKIVENLTIANGLAWSPDNTTMYLADRPNWQILAFDFDLTKGEVISSRQFAALEPGQFPDGATVDDEGGYWIAIYGAGRIHRYLPDGSLDTVLLAPSQYPTNVTFGGENLDTLFVTTACLNSDETELARDKLAGSLFACDRLGFTGLPEPRFVHLRSIRGTRPPEAPNAGPA